jgi:hypothetical protein
VPAGLVSWFYDQERFRHRVAELAADPLAESGRLVAAVGGPDAAADGRVTEPVGRALVP